MSDFNKSRRQKFLSEKDYVEEEDSYRYGIQLAFESLSSNKPKAPCADSRHRWAIASKSLQLLLLNFTAGRPLEELKARLPEVIERFNVYVTHEVSPRSKNPPENVADTFEITQLDAYVYVFWLLALCRLLGHPEFIPTVISWVDKTRDYNRGRDGLFENVVRMLTGTCIEAPRVVLHAVPYRPLASATVRIPKERPALVKEFVEGWYKGMKPTYWYGAHTDGLYFGYWCLEAALATVLWDIDDSSYRDNLVYPKDLVDFAREREVAARAADAPKPHISRITGEQCPHAGRWGVLESPGSFVQERFFKEGDTFPEGIGRDGKEGPVIWIVMGREDGGPTRIE
ncbi:PoNe immunity protein domain-containing protein [Paraburkholderia bannensis]|uniref:PoNe immunity protein domain-containing protein n=1 Tax=Paraburkholderia bannensis TaxID=765414 RepID=UPI002AC3376A|nr:PoNe immunity protein domain-containing protein [Paraburkholderia bannensis]